LKRGAASAKRTASKTRATAKRGGSKGRSTARRRS
jgi:hypothetical protein